LPISVLALGWVLTSLGVAGPLVASAGVALVLWAVLRAAVRWAEVRTRLLLDALPGRQLALESDFRNGFLRERAFRQARQTLDRDVGIWASLEGRIRMAGATAVLATGAAYCGGLVRVVSGTPWLQASGESAALAVCSLGLWAAVHRSLWRDLRGEPSMPASHQPGVPGMEPGDAGPGGTTVWAHIDDALSTLQAVAPGLVKATVPALVSVPVLVQSVQDAKRRGIPLCDAVDSLGAVLEWLSRMPTLPPRPERWLPVLLTSAAALNESARASHAAAGQSPPFGPGAGTMAILAPRQALVVPGWMRRTLLPANDGRPGASDLRDAVETLVLQAEQAGARFVLVDAVCFAALAPYWPRRPILMLESEVQMEASEASENTAFHRNSRSTASERL
jgi:hypothetical protein